MAWNDKQIGLKCTETLWDLSSREGDVVILIVSSMLGQEELERTGDILKTTSCLQFIIPTMPSSGAWNQEGSYGRGKKSRSTIWKTSNHDQDRPRACQTRQQWLDWGQTREEGQRCGERVLLGGLQRAWPQSSLMLHFSRCVTLEKSLTFFES